MISKFFAAFIANVSEELLMDMFRTIVKEFTLKRKKGDIDQVRDNLNRILEETANAELTNAEKNARLSDAGRAVADRLRDR